ncbi:MAG TPA: hypothetical protein VK324_11350 [Tepidisphaeraceae bacterium]|nr:hypothetical protein [Tepidisphaeraceae bacterium]
MHEQLRITVTGSGFFLRRRDVVSGFLQAALLGDWLVQIKLDPVVDVESITL